MNDDELLSDVFTDADNMLNDLYGTLLHAQYIIQSPYEKNETPFERARYLQRVIKKAEKELAQVLKLEPKE